MIIEQSHITRIQHDSIDMSISGHVKLLYEESGLTVVVDSIPVMFFNNVGIKDIVSDITIELI